MTRDRQWEHALRNVDACIAGVWYQCVLLACKRCMMQEQKLLTLTLQRKHLMMEETFQDEEHECYVSQQSSLAIATSQQKKRTTRDKE